MSTEPDKPEVVAVINYKGGVGKTTLTTNLGAELARRGRRVLLMDLDPQSSLTFSFVKPDYWKDALSDSRTIKSWFDGFGNGDRRIITDLIYSPSTNQHFMLKGRLDLIPSHLGLINVDLELATELGGASLAQAKHNYLRVHRRLLDGLRDLDGHGYDYVLIDCPPNFNVVTKTAIVASKHLLIPAKPDYLSTLGIDYLVRSLNGLVSDYNEFAVLHSPDRSETISPSVLGVVFTMVGFYGGRPIGAMRPFIEQTKRLEVPVFDNELRENKTLFSESAQYGLPVVLTDQSGDTYRQVVRELRQFTAEFEQKVGETSK